MVIMTKKEKKKGKEIMKRFIEEFIVLRWDYPLKEEQMLEFRDSLYKKIDEGCEGHSIIEFNNYYQILHKETHELTESAVMIHRMGADAPVWFQSNKDQHLDAIAYIGQTNDNKTHAVWVC